MRTVVASTAAALAGIALAGPLLSQHHALAALAITGFFSFICHQDPARSFWIAAAPMAVCARCLGIYAGAAVGAWVRIPHARALRFLAVALAVNVLDVLVEAAGLLGNWPAARFGLGAGLGAAIALLLVSAAPANESFSISDF